MKRVVCLILILFCSISFVSAETYTRKEMQDFVLSTALSYYDNNKYSDYEQYSMNTAKNFSWTTAIVSPEGLGRSQYLNTSCAAFTTLCYDYSLGFNFKKYKNLVDYSTSGKGSADFDYIYYYLGYGPSTSFFERIGKKNNNINGGIVAYYHEVKLDSNRNYVESESERKAILNKIKSVFQPGDIFIARRTMYSDGVLKTKGHAMLYVGNLVNSKETGFIHSTGNDINYDKDPVFLGDDAQMHSEVDLQSIRYNSYDTIIQNQLYTNVKGDGKEKRTVSITILRPINEYCSGNSCNITTLNKNAKARAYFMRLKVEQYLSEKNGTTNKVIGYNYSSVNYYDNLTYNLSLKYNNKEFTGITVKAPIPKNSTFVSCSSQTKDKSNKTVSDKYKCTHDSNYVYWENVTVNSTYKESIFKVTFKNKNETKMTFNGYQVIKGSNKLLLDEVTTNINPTLNNVNGKKIRDNYNKYNGNNTLNYISNVYKGIFGIDLSYLNYTDIKNSIFENNKRRTESSSNYLSGNAKLIDKMLVPGFYGGFKAEGNTRKDRIRFLNSKFYEIGDILVTYKGNKTSAYLYLGIINDCSTFVDIVSNNRVIHGCGSEFNSNGTLKKAGGYRLIKEAHGNDYFVVLRPSRVYGSTIVYNYNGANKISTDNIFAYKTYGDLYTPTKTGYTFDGWYKESDFKNKISSSTSLSNDKKVYNVYAKWINNNVGYTVKHWKQNVDGNASSMDNKNYTLVKTETSSAKEKTRVTVVPKQYTGFKSPSAQTIVVDGTGSQVINYYYTRNYYKLDLKSGTGIKSVSGSGNYLYGSSVTIDAVVKDGYTFKNWTDGSDVVTSKKKYSFTRKAASRTFTANATANTYTITFDRQKGSDGTSTLKATFDASLSAITIPTRSGYKFLGYYKTTDTSGTKYYDSTGKGLKKYDIVGNTTLYANWQANTYTVSYKANGGNGTMSSSSHTYGTKKALNENKFTREGYKFLGWSKKSDATKASYSDKQEVSALTTTDKGTVTLYAVWSAKNDIEYKVIHYKQNISNDDYYVNEREFLSGTANTNVTPEVRTYNGFTSPNTKTVKIEPDGSTVIKYYYKRISSKVNLVKGVGIKSVSGAGTYKYGASFTLSCEVKDGYTFVNWTDNETGKQLTKQQTATYERGAVERTFKANARANTYKINYNGNGSTSGNMASSMFTYDSKSNLRANAFKRDNYVFKGWSSNKEGDNVDYKDKQEVLNLTSVDSGVITLYAIWEEKEEKKEEEPVEVIIDIPVDPGDKPIDEKPVVEKPVETKKTEEKKEDNKQTETKTEEVKEEVIVEAEEEEDQKVVLENPDELVGLSTSEKLFGMKTGEMIRSGILIIILSVVMFIVINKFKRK